MTSSGTRLTVKSGAQAGLTERANFLELRFGEVQLRRIILLGSRVNKGKREGRSY
jgi:hypothetical protein